MSGPIAPRLRRMPWWLWTSGAVIAATGIVAALGGFAEVPVQQLPELRLGEEHVGNEITTVVDGVVLSRERPSSEYDDEEHDYVVVNLTVTNSTTTPTLFLSNSVRIVLGDVVDEFTAPDGATDPRNGTQVQFLQPGLPTEVAMSWQVTRGDVAVGDDIRIGVFERYDAPEDPRYRDAKTAPVVVAKLDTTVGEAP
ncbi:MAG TPA: hypothetical protein VN200_08220 [Rhodoglobus sp.]|nr:hypothetical protein [Rhodoglobus sp.]